MGRSKAVRVSDRAVAKASRERLLEDMRLAEHRLWLLADNPDIYLDSAEWETSRTRYACLMTAFGL